MEIKLSVPDFTTVELPVEQYIRQYNRRKQFEAMCARCDNWARRWGCPPFDHDPLKDLLRYSHVSIRCITARVISWPDTAGIKEMTDAIQRLRKDIEPQMLDDERNLNGFASLFTGQCYHCGNSPCARLSGDKCRFPEKVRPSLEALGFDLSQTASQLFNTDLQWYHPQKPHPQKITILGAIFYNKTN